MPLQYLVSKPDLPCYIFFTTPGKDKPHKAKTFFTTMFRLAAVQGNFKDGYGVSALPRRNFWRGGRRALVDKGVNPENVEIKIVERKGGGAWN